MRLPRRDELDLEAREQLDQREGGGVRDPLITLHNISQCDDSTAVHSTQFKTRGQKHPLVFIYDASHHATVLFSPISAQLQIQFNKHEVNIVHI